MLDIFVKRIVNENLDIFFKRILNDTYEKRRQTLSETNKEVQPVPVIDYVLRSCIGPEAKYPPESAQQWHEYYSKLVSGYSHVFQHLLLIYLKLDISNYLNIRERESTTGRQTRAKDRAELTVLGDLLAKLENISYVFDFTNSVVKLSAGFWALDNDQPNQMVACLSDPTVNLANYFESPRELIRIIVGSLYISDNPRMALYMSKIHRYENWDEVYDPLYAYLLLNSGQLVEALKYERLFVDQENYNEILQRFFELCSKCDVTRSLNCLNLSIEEEEILNQHLIVESRPVTPSSTQHQIRHVLSSSSMANLTSSSKPRVKHTPRNRSIQMVQRMPSFNDSPAKNTRSARKKKTTN